VQVGCSKVRLIIVVRVESRFRAEPSALSGRTLAAGDPAAPIFFKTAEPLNPGLLVHAQTQLVFQPIARMNRNSAEGRRICNSDVRPFQQGATRR
jgi:hypothetical protein